MQSLARVLIVVALAAASLTGCASHRLLSKEQARQLRSNTRVLRTALPGVHAAIAASHSTGALIVFEADGTMSPPYFGVTAEAAAEQRFEAQPDAERSELTAVFILGTRIAKRPTWHSLSELQAGVSNRRSLQRSLDEISESTSLLEAQVSKSSDSVAALVDQVSRLEAFGIEMTQLGLVQQAMLDGFQDQLTALRKSVASLQEASRVSAEGAASTQALLGETLKSISDRLAAIETNLKRF